MGSVRLEESGEWSGGVPECRTAHAAHQQRVESGGPRPAGLSRSLAAKRIFATSRVMALRPRTPPTVEEEGAFCS